MDTADWRGRAHDQFEAAFQKHPKQWRSAADACGEAKTALDSYTHVLTWAQSQAQLAIDEYHAAQQAAKREVDGYNQKVNAYNNSDRNRRDHRNRLCEFPEKEGHA
jgi:hypothetical protein